MLVPKGKVRGTACRRCTSARCLCSSEVLFDLLVDTTMIRVYIYIYIYIYIWCTCMYVYIVVYIYIYIYNYREREKERDNRNNSRWKQLSCGCGYNWLKKIPDVGKPEPSTITRAMHNKSKILHIGRQMRTKWDTSVESCGPRPPRVGDKYRIKRA